MSGHPAPQSPRRRRPSDDEVAALPLSAGRAELLEEIMSTPVRDRVGSSAAAPPSHPRRTRWLAPLAAAAVVAGLATVPLWAGGDGPEGGVATESTVPAGGYVVLDRPGWTVDHVSRSADGQDVRFVNGARELEISSRPEALYDEYVADREGIVDPPAPGEPVEVLGTRGQQWAYSEDDHTTIREPQDGVSLELRGQGMDEAAYRRLLGDLRQVDEYTFEAALPSRFQTAAERPAAVQDMLDGIAAALAPEHGLVPAGEAVPTVDSDESDPYQLGAEVSGTVACRWIAAYEQARTAGDRVAARDAADAMSTSRQWPVLREMDAEGDYPEVVWEISRDMSRGRDVPEYQAGLGCE